MVDANKWLVRQPLDDSRRPEPRIIRLRYRSGVNGRVATAIAKVPYSGLFDLSEKMARLLAKGQVRWFRMDPATVAEIEAARDALQRWPDALRATVDLTRIDLDA